MRVAAVALCVVLAGCGEQKMADQPRYDTFEPSTFFDDGLSARPLVPGTVARGRLRDDSLLYTGRTRELPLLTDLTRTLERAGLTIDPLHSDTFPFPVTRPILERGQERYNIFCVVCHGHAGVGNGRIVERGYVRPPSYHIERLRKAPPGYYFDVITHGYGAMPSYRVEVPPRDRWAIIAYIRALQLSRSVPVGDLTAEERAKLDEETQRKPSEQGGRE